MRVHYINKSLQSCNCSHVPLNSYGYAMAAIASYCSDNVVSILGVLAACNKQESRSAVVWVVWPTGTDRPVTPGCVKTLTASFVHDAESL